MYMIQRMRCGCDKCVRVGRNMYLYVFFSKMLAPGAFDRLDPDFPFLWHGGLWPLQAQHGTGLCQRPPSRITMGWEDGEKAAL